MSVSVIECPEVIPMRVFVTGASGWIGSAAVDDLLAAGHDVVGLARSDTSAAALEAKGGTVLRGDLDDLDAIGKGAADADGVVHLANKHDWSNPAASNAAERAAVEMIAETLVGTQRPFVLASGVAGLAHGRPGTEEDRSPAHGPDSPRGGAENLALEYVDRGVRIVSARFAPTVHGDRDHGFIAYIVAAAREKGVSAYVGEGANRWSAVHRSDAARLVRLGLEQAPAGSILHAVAEEGVPTKAIAEAIGRGLGLPVASVAPEKAVDHFGFIGSFFAMDLAASRRRTQELLGWTPSGPTLVDDIDAGAYFH
jgi:nucleoside-diphosphate-sugar epimerase